ncbi:alpha/beta hydrolase [Enhydrobacter sp.]|jgi:acetyl esterase/lipase|uniref:alpha/beta hydrolase n=1 Tax=Enhydrobacter sp. TaxID=1894999 RepID=UPI00260A2F8A|nr:alpha/beta hydrolase [Enhydrobacter sp.]WIM09924.1 MAG: putative esterase [Enhydrobacter sp.]
MTAAQLDSLVTLLRSRPAPETRDVAQARARFEKLAGFLGGAPDARCEKVDAGGVAAEWIMAPGCDPGRAVLYLHGGGYAIGSINTHRRLAYDISAASAAAILVIDYRLAPEHPFPAALDDATAAWRWLAQQGFPAGRLAIAGDSAGGGLTIATLVNLRDRKLGLPACAVAISPWVDLEGLGDSITARAEQDPMVQKDGLLWMAGMYLDGRTPKAPLAAPLHADLKGLPPVLVRPARRRRCSTMQRASRKNCMAPATTYACRSGPTCCMSSPCSRPSSPKDEMAAPRSAPSSATDWPEP